MLRLSTTTGLSLLALAISVTGTGWLSTLTSRTSAPSPTANAAAAEYRAPVRAQSRQPTHRRGPVSVLMHSHHMPNASPISALAGVQSAAIKSPVELIPLTTPSDNSRPWYQLQDHLDGRVVLHLTIDGNGRVTAAAMRESSGDPILDDHALRSVHRWRFAVPSDHPNGLSGDLPMRFASRPRDVASAR
ncbi:MAG: energy transducer TonB [Rhodanobacter sp.]